MDFMVQEPKKLQRNNDDYIFKFQILSIVEILHKKYFLTTELIFYY
jgi:hypothetical protein